MKDNRPDVNLQAIDGHLTWTKDGKVIAWYLIPAVRSSFPVAGEVDQSITDFARVIAQLVGRIVHVRRTWTPYPVADWGREVAEDVARQVGSGVPGTPGTPLPGWPEYHAATQRHLMSKRFASSQAFIGVELDERPPTSVLLGRVGKHRQLEMQRLGKPLRKIDTLMKSPGLGAEPADFRDVERLLHQSCCIGLPAAMTLPHLPVAWGEGDIAAITDKVRWESQPLDRCVKVTAIVGGQTVTRYVTVLTVGRTQDKLRIPEDMEPWAQRSDRLDRLVEWSIRMEPQSDADVTSWARRQGGKITAQIEQFTVDHKMRAPEALARQAQLAAEVENRATSGSAEGLLSGVDVWARCAVSGVSAEDCEEAAERLTTLYGGRMQLESSFDVYSRLEEFIPGGRQADTAHQRKYTAAMAAASLPQATAKVGHDRGGIYLGMTCGVTRRKVTWATHRSMEREYEQSGLTIVAAGLGGGKSTTTGLIVAESALQGVKWDVLDPSGQLYRITEWPRLAPYSRHVALADAAPGTLSPNRVIPNPKLSQFEFAEDGRRYSEDEQRTRFEWQDRRAHAQRRTITRDVLFALLRPSVSRKAEVGMILDEAVRNTQARFIDSPREVIKTLEAFGGAHGQTAKYIAGQLREAADMPQGQLIFPSGSMLDYDHDSATPALLTVYTLKGLIMPTEGDKDRDSWSLDERFSVPLMNLAAWLTRRSIYDTDRHQRKGLVFDEGHAITSTPSGRNLYNTSSRDTRKHYLRCIFSSQNIADALVAGVANFVDSVFLGRTEDEQAARAGLELMGLPTNTGYVKTVTGLSPHVKGSKTRGARQFLFSDGTGQVERIEIDMEDRDGLLDYLDTTADPSAAVRELVEA